MAGVKVVYLAAQLVGRKAAYWVDQMVGPTGRTTGRIGVAPRAGMKAAPMAARKANLQAERMASQSAECLASEKDDSTADRMAARRAMKRAAPMVAS